MQSQQESHKNLDQNETYYKLNINTIFKLERPSYTTAHTPPESTTGRLNGGNLEQHRRRARQAAAAPT